jgi:hypothetical protein
VPVVIRLQHVHDLQCVRTTARHARRRLLACAGAGVCVVVCVPTHNTPAGRVGCLPELPCWHRRAAVLC